jgi:outer membrane protein TolC
MAAMDFSYDLKDLGLARGRSSTRAGLRSISTKRIAILALGLGSAALIAAAPAVAQQTPPPAANAQAEVQFIHGPAQSSPPPTITFQDALERARKLDPTLVGAMSDAKSAHEDRTQARNAMLPTISETTQYLGTQGNGGLISDGRFVTNDGIHVYREWGVLHQDLSPGLLMGTAYTRAKAAEALANAKSEIARRGLVVTVTKAYYTLVVAQRKYAVAQTALDQTQRFLNITQDLEKQGQGSHSDTINAEVQYRTQVQAFDEARFAMEDARLTLAVVIFPDFNENFAVVDDLENAPALPPFSETQSMAEKENPDIRVAIEAAREADLDVKLAKTAFLPTLTIDTDYGIEANCFALRCARAAFPDIGVVPNLGYFLTAALNIPVWDWGTLHSKLKQADYKQETAKAQLSLAQRTAVSELYATYDEAMVAKAAVEEARRTAELAQEALRLMTLRFQGGASAATDVTVAQTAVITAQNAFADALVRYRTLLSTLQTFTGPF